MNGSCRSLQTRIGFIAAYLAWGGILIPFRPGIATGAERAIPILDVALSPSGSLHGAVMSAEGLAKASTKLELRGEGGVVRQTLSDASGRFAFENLSAGRYQLVTDHSDYYCRVWTNDAAPPSAVSDLLVVSDARIARAQRPMSEMFVYDPLWISVAVAAAVIIPIAIHNSGGDRKSGS